MKDIMLVPVLIIFLMFLLHQHRWVKDLQKQMERQRERNEAFSKFSEENGKRYLRENERS